MTEKKRVQTGTETTAAQTQSTQPKLQNSRKPALILTGIAGLSIAALIWGASDDEPDDPVVDVQRTHYETREACLADWNDPADCDFIRDDAATADASSEASALNLAASDAFASESVGLLDASDPFVTSAATSGGSSHTTILGHGGWYGPYYTREGVIYHSSGISTTGNVPVQPRGETSSLSVRGSSLMSRSSVFTRTPRSVSSSEGMAISRGGFTSHGGGEGGHGFGGSRGG
jgi:hypothetical protein